MLFWLLGLLLALVVAVFASHNPLMIDINFFGWVIENVALSVIILLSAFLGALISFLFSGVKQLAMGREIKKTRKALEETSKRELQHLEEIKELQLAKEKALVEAERNATGDIRAYQDDLRAKDEQIKQLQEQLEKLAATTASADERTGVPPEASEPAETEDLPAEEQKDYREEAPGEKDDNDSEKHEDSFAQEEDTESEKKENL